MKQGRRRQVWRWGQHQTSSRLCVPLTISMLFFAGSRAFGQWSSLDMPVDPRGVATAATFLTLKVDDGAVLTQSNSVTNSTLNLFSVLVAYEQNIFHSVTL